MEIPTLPEKERQNIFTQMWVGQIIRPIGFIMQWIGEQALKEYNEQGAKSSAENFRAMKSEDPMGFVMSNAVVNKNIFGSDVDVIVNNDGSVTMDIKECSNLKVALEFAAKGVPVTKEDYCDGCMNGYFKLVAENLGLKFSGEFMEKGCKMTVAR